MAAAIRLYGHRNGILAGEAPCHPAGTAVVRCGVQAGRRHGHHLLKKPFLQDCTAELVHSLRMKKPAAVGDELNHGGPLPSPLQAPTSTKPSPHRANGPGYGGVDLGLAGARAAANQTIP